MLQNSFHLDRRLGIGATAEVFLARRKDSGEARALKVFTPIVLADEDTVRRIQNEIDTQRALSHRNIVRLFDSHGDKENYALELEYVDGSDLRTWAKGYKLSMAEPKIWILSQVARGLGAAHGQGILHRDLKPENILVSRFGDVKLTDFGLARQLDSVTLTKTGVLMGSIGYLAPEILDGKRPSPKSDIFSFGAVAYELIAGKNPFEAATPQAALKNLLQGTFRPLKETSAGYPPSILALVEQCLHPDPDQRPRTIWHVEGDLMAELGASLLNKYCKSLVSADERDEALVAAFAAKREELKGRQLSLAETNASRPLWIELARDWNHAFPDSSESVEILGQLARPASPSRRWSSVAILLLLVSGAGFYFLRTSSSTAPATSAATVVLNPAPLAPMASTPATTTPTNTPEPALAPAAAAAAAKPKIGWLRLDADPDVKIFLNDREIPSSRWNRLSMPAGEHRLKMVKEGFLPIENTILVRPNKLVSINARGGQ